MYPDDGALAITGADPYCCGAEAASKTSALMILPFGPVP